MLSFKQLRFNFFSTAEKGYSQKGKVNGGKCHTLPLTFSILHIEDIISLDFFKVILELNK